MATTALDSLFEEEWKGFDGQEFNLESLAAFNASFADTGDIDSSAAASIGSNIDPQLLTSTPSPSTYCGPLQTDGTSGFEANMGEGDLFGFCPAPPVNSPNNTMGPYPFFHQSIEPPAPSKLQQAIYATPPGPSQFHRRSSSAPPQQHQYSERFQPQHLPPLNPTFTRAGTLLGTPKASLVTTSRPSGRNRQPMHRQPYSVAKRPTPRSDRYHLRQTQTRPVQGPTSAPAMDTAHHPPAPNMTPPVVSSRVCTPAPPRPRVQGQVGADPEAPSPFSAPRLRSPHATTAIPVTLEELKAMITDAVGAAVKPIWESKFGDFLFPFTVDADVDRNTCREVTEGSAHVAAGMDGATVAAVDEDVRTSIVSDDSLFVTA